MRVFAIGLLLVLAGCASSSSGVAHDDEFERCAAKCMPTTTNQHDAAVMCRSLCESERARRSGAL
jgi:hypothetical protein